MKDLFFLRLCVVLAVVILAGTTSLWVLLDALLSTPELVGPQVLPRPDSTSDHAWLSVVPQWLAAVVAVLCGIKPWVYALGVLALLPVLPVLLSFGVDWAAGARRGPGGNRGAAPDKIPRPLGHGSRPKGHRRQR